MKKYNNIKNNINNWIIDTIECVFYIFITLIYLILILLRLLLISFCITKIII